MENKIPQTYEKSSLATSVIDSLLGSLLYMRKNKKIGIVFLIINIFVVICFTIISIVYRKHRMALLFAVIALICASIYFPLQNFIFDPLSMALNNG